MKNDIGEWELMKKSYKVCMVLIAVGCLVAFNWYILSRKPEPTADKTEDSTLTYYHMETSINQIGDVVVDKNNSKNIAFYSEEIVQPYELLNSKWLFLYSGERAHDSDRLWIHHYKDFKIQQYDIYTKKLVHEYEVSKFVEEEQEKKFVYFYKVRKIKDRHLLSMSIVSDLDKIKLYPKSVILDPESQVLSLMDTEDLPEDYTWIQDNQPDDYGKQLWIFKNFELTNEYTLLEMNGISATDGHSFIVEVSPSGSAHLVVSTSNLPEQNEALYTMFPGIKKYRDEAEDSEGYIIFLLDGQPSPEEILKLFLEEGEEISLEGLTLPADSTIDEQEHAITSFEEYYQWRDFEKKATIVY